MDEMEVDHVIKVTLTNEILKRISEIDEKRFSLSTIEMPPVIKNRLRKNSKKKSSYASNKIEGNPLTEKQANEAIDSDPHKHFLKPEQEGEYSFLQEGPVFFNKSSSFLCSRFSCLSFFIHNDTNKVLNYWN